MHLKTTVCGWAVFVWGIAILFAGDAAIRSHRGTFGASGLAMPELLWFGLPLILGTVSVILLWRGTAHLHHIWLRSIVVGVQVMLGFIMYSIGCLAYVINTGIDSL